MGLPHYEAWEPVGEGLTELGGALIDYRENLANQGRRAQEARKRRVASRQAKYEDLKERAMAVQQQQFGKSKIMGAKTMTGGKEKAPPPKNKPQSKDKDVEKNSSPGYVAENSQDKAKMKRKEQEEAKKKKSVSKSLFDIGMHHQRAKYEYISKRYGTLW